MIVIAITGMPPPRMMRPPGGPPGIMPPGLPPPPGVAPPQQNPNVLSAPPSIMKLPQKTTEEKKDTSTISAKPQIKNVMGDVTRFTPTALKVKREPKDARLKKASKYYKLAVKIYISYEKITTHQYYYF